MKRTIAALATAILMSVALATPAPAARGCGTFKVEDGARIHAKIIRGSTTCKTAKSILRRYLDSDAPCSGSGCAREIKGWSCSAALASAFPRLASCSRKNTTVSAYSTAD